MKFELCVYGPGFNQPTLDPNCLSMIALLQFLSLDYTILESRNPACSPTGHLPFLLADGQPIVGIESIKKFLVDSGHDLDSQLSRDEEFQSTAYQSLIQTKLYDALLYTMWIESDNYESNTLPAYSSSLSFIPRFFFPYQMRDMAKDRLSLYALDIQDSKSTSQVYSDARECFRALSCLLGDKDYFFGSKPCSLDAIAYGHLCFHSYPSFKNSQLFISLAFEAPNIISYLDRIQTTYFSQAIPKSIRSRPRTLDVLLGLGNSLNSVWENAKGIHGTKDQEFTEKEVQERRIKSFYNGFSILVGLAAFSIFSVRFGVFRDLALG